MHFDVFNGDADGIIALLQLRFAEPKESVLVTGVKRDIALVKNIDLAEATSVTVLDISLEKNIAAVNILLENQVDVLYIDHHRSGAIPRSSHLRTLINTDANTCTSLLVNDYLEGAYVTWAIAAAYGDNMNFSAEKLAEKIGLNEPQKSQLKALGIYINYNGYGRTVSDLHYAPEALYKELSLFENPFDLISDETSVFHQLESAYLQDMHKAQLAKVLAKNTWSKVVELVDEPWAHRVSGVLGNDLANQSPSMAHAVLTPNADGETYTVSVRAPLNNKQGADEICIQFPTGGGRSAAAGINKLPKESLALFIDTLSKYYQ